MLLDNNTNTPDTTKYWQIECITYGIAGTPATQYFEQTARALGQGTVIEYKRSGNVSGDYSASATVTWGSWQKITPSASISSGSTDPVTGDAINTALSGKQDALVSGTSIKTVAGTSLLGSGNIAVATLSGANAGAVCSTAKATAAKEVTIDGFSLFTGVTVKVMFSNGNSAASPTLNVSSTGDIDIKVNKAGSKVTPINHTGYWRGASSTSSEMWQPNTILELMYDGTDWVISGNPVVESYYTANNSYSVYADGLIEQWVSSEYSNSQQNATFNVLFANTDYIFDIAYNGTTYTDKGRSFGYNVKTVTNNGITYQVNFTNAGGESKNSSLQTKVYAKGV